MSKETRREIYEYTVGTYLRITHYILCPIAFIFVILIFVRGQNFKERENMEIRGE